MGLGISYGILPNAFDLCHAGVGKEEDEKGLMEQFCDEPFENGHLVRVCRRVRGMR